MRSHSLRCTLFLFGIVAAQACGKEESTTTGGSGGAGASTSESASGGEATTGSMSSGSAGNGGTGGGGESCTPGATEVCYGGPAGTEGIGTCKSGKRTCNADGKGFGPCEGEVLPAPESCATPEDEDCDGTNPTCGSDNLWSKRFGVGEPFALAVDAQGNPFLVGRFPSTITFGGNTLTSSGGFDAFVVKFDGASGEHLWSRRLGGAEDQAAYGVAVDPEGNVIVVGEFLGQMSVGGGNTLTSAGGNDVFVAKYDGESGDHIWSKRYGDGEDQSARGAAITKTGEAFVTGSFAGSTDFGAGTLTSAGSFDVFVLKLDASGNTIYAKRFGDADEQNGRAVAVDTSGTPVITGDFRGAMDFGSAVLASAGNFDLFVTRLDATGSPVYAKGYGNKDPQRGYSITTNAMGNAVVSGIVRGDVDLGGGVLSAQNLDVFLLELTPSGAHVRSRIMGGNKADSAGGIAIGQNGRIIVAGGYQSQGKFGGVTLPSKGGYDVFLARHDNAADLVNVDAFGDGGDQMATAIATDAAGRIFLAAQVSDMIDFGQGELPGANGSVAIAKLAP